MEEQFTSLLREFRAGRLKLDAEVNESRRAQAEHRTLLDSINARFSYWDKTLLKAISPDQAPATLYGHAGVGGTVRDAGDVIIHAAAPPHGEGDGAPNTVAAGVEVSTPGVTNNTTVERSSSQGTATGSESDLDTTPDQDHTAGADASSPTDVEELIRYGRSITGQDTRTDLSDAGERSTSPGRAVGETKVPTHNTAQQAGTVNGEVSHTYADMASQPTRHKPTLTTNATRNTTPASPTTAESQVGGNNDGDFVRQKRRHNKPRRQGPPARGSKGWGNIASCRLGRPPNCEVMVRYLPHDFPEEELIAYITQMLQDDQVQVRVLWRRKTAAFVVTTHGRHGNTLLNMDNWEEHVHVQRYYPPRSPASGEGSSGATAPTQP